MKLTFWRGFWIVVLAAGGLWPVLPLLLYYWHKEEVKA